MTKPAARKRRARGSIDPDKILDGAFELAGRVGLDNMSMPDLALHLDVGVTSIYWYFRSKDDLLSKMARRANLQVSERMESPDGYRPDQWKNYLSGYFHSMREIYAESDLLTDVILMRTASYSRSTTVQVYEGVEKLLAFLVAAGFTPSAAWYVLSTCTVYTRGFAVVERIRRQNGTPPVGRLQLDLLDVDAMPLLKQVIDEEPIFIDMTGDSAFDFAIELILDAAERQIGSASS